MIHDEEEYEATLRRIAHLQKQVAHLRKVETSPDTTGLRLEAFSLNWTG
ncbi:MAG: hypothetical protein AB1646_02655 [Thermodesulfobacteriota bacterium]